MNAIKIDTAADFKRLVKHEPFKVVYRKANGRFRSAEAQLGVTHDSLGRLLVKGKLSDDDREIENETGTIRYFDKQKDGYRQFGLDKMTILETGGQKYNFQF